MEHARPPAELRIDGSPAARAAAWQKWWKQFEVFLKASGVNKEDADVQASLLVNLIGPEGYEIYSTFTFEDATKTEDLTSIKAKFDLHFGTKSNITMVRFKFFTRNQNAGENINQYVTALRVLSKGCEFETLTDGLIRDRIVCGITNNVVRDRLLRADGLTLEKAVQICEADEISKEENRQIEESSVQVNEVAGGRGRGSGRRRSAGSRGRPGPGPERGAAGTSGTQRGRAAAAPAPARPRAQCARCGSVFCRDEERCPAVKAMCFVCDRRGHFARVCSSKPASNIVDNVSVSELTDDSEDNAFYVDVVISELKQSSERCNQWIEYLDYKGKRLSFKLDTGSMLNILCKCDYERLGLKIELLVPYNKRVFSYTGNSVPIIGECTLDLTFKERVYKIRLVVADMQCQNILGLDGCIKLGVIQRVNALNVNNYAELFSGLGKLPGLHRIIVDESVQPVICPARRIPMGMREKLQDELVRMEKLGVIRKVTHPTEWVNPIVIAAKKSGEIRVCLDPRVLNTAVRRAHFSLPTVSELAARLRGAGWFSVLDARCGFWMLQLDEVSANLCTFSTPFGRFQFLRLPYGINCAPEVFHAKIRQHLEDLEGTDSFIDDIIVWGATKEEHDARLERLLQRAKEIGIRFNKAKCKFGVREIVYLGHVFDAQGMRADDAKVKAIVGMPDPVDRKSLERFLGMVNYLSKFIPNYSESVAVLRSLLRKDSEWLWDREHSRAITMLKEKISSAPVLSLYSTEIPIVVSVDASSEALGAVMLQGGRPVEFASVTLTDTQRRYAQIEKEMLAIVYACERFHQYVFGRSDVTVQTDHKPLESIFKKPLSAVPARLQRMMMRIQGYDIKVQYTPGKFMYIADTLSRAALPELLHEQVSKEVEAQTCFMIEHLQFSDKKLALVKKHVQNDEYCKPLIKYIATGWPRNRYEVIEPCRIFWPYRESLQYVDGLILKDNQVYIPHALRDEMVRRVHEGHLGIERCKRRAREALFWPGLSVDVERRVRACAACALHAPAPRREPLVPHAVPDVPWCKLGSDIFEYRKKYYLLIVDYFSNYVEINELTSINSKCVVASMKEQFARHGIPKELVTDNGPAYSSREFEKFISDWEIAHITSSPLYPQSNGKSERTVRTVKNLLKKCVDSGEDYYVSLLNFRATPRDGVDSAAQILFGRRLNTRLPIYTPLLSEKVDNKQNHAAIEKRQLKIKSAYDKSARNLPSLPNESRVVVADGKDRRFMQVVSKSAEPRSYILQDAVGRRYRRNRRHIISRVIKQEPLERGDVTAPAPAPPAPADSQTAHAAPSSSAEYHNAGDDKACISAQVKSTDGTENVIPPITRSKARMLAEQSEQYF